MSRPTVIFLDSIEDIKRAVPFIKKVCDRVKNSPLVIVSSNFDTRPLGECPASEVIYFDEFLTRESQKYSVTTRRPTITRLGPVMEKHPPPSPPSGSNLPAIMWWGLKFRYWAFRNTPDSESNLYRIRIFVHYHQTLEDRTLQHSLGLDKGLLAVVHAFASEDQDEQNNIVIAHELLHTVGATDKYDESSEPVFPVGYANPDQIPLYPQTRAEIMTGRIPLTSHTSRMAESLNECIISLHTAQEINWTDRVVQ